MGGAFSTCGREQSTYRGLLGNLRKRAHVEDPDVDGSIIIRWIFRKWDGRPWTGSMWLRIGTDGGHL